MNIRTRVLAATVVAAGTLAVPAAIAANSAQAGAAADTCIHVYVGPSGGPGIIEIAVHLPSLKITTGGPC
jgi:hypothetical protein